MLPSLETREAQASALLDACCQEPTRSRLRAYAGKLAGDEGEELLQQALLDAHDAVQARGTSCSAPDYGFFVMTILKRRLVDEQRRRAKLSPLPDAATDWQQLPDCDSRAHLADQISAYVCEHAAPEDRVAFRLDVDGHSSRKIAELTGRNYRAVHRAVARLKEQLRAAFGTAMEGL